MKIPSVSDTFKIFDRGVEYSNTRPRIDVMLVALLLAMSISVDIPLGRTGIFLSLKYLIPIVSIFLAVNFGRQYRNHIIIGTLPLLVGIEISRATDYGALIYYGAGPSGLFFANLVIHRLSYSQSLRKEVFSRSALSLGFLGFLSIGLYLFVNFSEYVLDTLNDTWFRHYQIESAALDPRLFIGAVAFIVGATRIPKKRVLFFASSLFILSFISKSVEIDGLDLHDVWFQSFLSLTYATPQFYTFLVGAVVMGSLYRRWHSGAGLENREQNIGLAVLLCAIFLTQVSFSADYAVEVRAITTSAQEDLTVDELTEIAPQREAPENLAAGTNVEIEPIIVREPHIVFSSRFHLVDETLVALMLFTLGLFLSFTRVLIAIGAWYLIIVGLDFLPNHLFYTAGFRSIGLELAAGSGRISAELSSHGSLVRFGSLGLVGRGSGVVGVDYIFVLFGFALAFWRRAAKRRDLNAQGLSIGNLTPARVASIVIGVVVISYVLHRFANLIFLTGLVVLNLEDSLY